MRVNVLGASGSGVSALGRALAKVLAVPHFELDDYYHIPTDPPFLQQYTPQERYERLMTDLSGPAAWVLSGSIMGWEPYPSLRFTAMVLLHTPTALRLERLKQRESARFGARIQPGGDLYQNHREFLEWAAHYDSGGIEGKTWARHQAYLAQQTCPTCILSGEAPLPELTQAVQAFLSEAAPRAAEE